MSSLVTVWLQSSLFITRLVLLTMKILCSQPFWVTAHSLVAMTVDSHLQHTVSSSLSLPCCLGAHHRENIVSNIFSLVACVSIAEDRRLLGHFVTEFFFSASTVPPFSCYVTIWSENSSVGIVTKLQLYDWEIKVWLLTEMWDFSLLHCLDTGSGAHPALIQWLPQMFPQR
jgi:hypothetical protein